MLKKHRLQEEKDGRGEEKEAALREELEAHPAPPSLPEPNDSQPEAEEKTFSEDLDPEVSTPAELPSCVLHSRPWHLITREKISMHVCVCVTCFLQHGCRYVLCPYV